MVKGDSWMLFTSFVSSCQRFCIQLCYKASRWGDVLSIYCGICLVSFATFVTFAIFVSFAHFSTFPTTFPLLISAVLSSDAYPYNFTNALSISAPITMLSASFLACMSARRQVWFSHDHHRKKRSEKRP